MRLKDGEGKSEGERWGAEAPHGFASPFRLPLH